MARVISLPHTPEWLPEALAESAFPALHRQFHPLDGAPTRSAGFPFNF